MLFAIHGMKPCPRNVRSRFRNPMNWLKLIGSNRENKRKMFVLKSEKNRKSFDDFRRKSKVSEDERTKPSREKETEEESMRKK